MPTRLAQDSSESISRRIKIESRRSKTIDIYNLTRELQPHYPCLTSDEIAHCVAHEAVKASCNVVWNRSPINLAITH